MRILWETLKNLGTVALLTGAIYGIYYLIKDPTIWVPLVLFLLMMATLLIKIGKESETEGNGEAKGPKGG